MTIEELVAAAGKPGALTGGIQLLSGPDAQNQSFQDADGVARIASPTLLVWAEEDRSLGKELTYGLSRYCVEEPVIRYIPECSHWVQQEQPLLVNRYLDEFL